MTSNTRSRRLLIIGAAVAVTGVGLAGCSSTTSSSSSTPATSDSAMSTPAMSSSAMSAAFGPGCAAVPKDGAGSFAGMAADPVATAASNNPALSTLVSAVKQADLVSTLNSADGVTVFAPTNDAFSAVPKQTLTSMMANKVDLSKVLTYHVVSGQLTPSELPGTHKTLEGQSLKVTGSGEDFSVNGAKVVCGNVKTANATVYIIDGVLTPPSS